MSRKSIDRIADDFGKLMAKYPSTDNASMIANALEAVSMHLDEERERVNGILHAIVRNTQGIKLVKLDGGIIDTKEILHAMIDETVTGSDE